MGIANIFRWNRISPFSQWGAKKHLGKLLLFTFSWSTLSHKARRDKCYQFVNEWAPTKKKCSPERKKRLMKIGTHHPLFGFHACFQGVIYILPAPWRCVSLLSLLLASAQLHVCEVIQVWMVSTWKTLLTIFGSWLAIWDDMQGKGYKKNGCLVKEEDTVTVCFWIISFLLHEMNPAFSSLEKLTFHLLHCQKCHGFISHVAKILRCYILPGQKIYSITRSNSTVCVEMLWWWMSGFKPGIPQEIHETSGVVDGE